MTMSGVAASPMQSQSLAETALTHLAASSNTHNTQGIQTNTPTNALTNGLAVYTYCAPVPALPPYQPTTSAPTQEHNAINGFSIAHVPASTAAAIAHHPLPSLPRYVDNELMQSASKHNHPPNPKAICNICYYPWDMPVSDTKDSSNGQAPVYTTFLPLSPCGHWVHYRCLIWHTTQDVPQRDKCAACGVQLFHWEGISALTLATRTGLTMGSDNLSFSSSSSADSIAYEKDCFTIGTLAHQTFFTHLALPSPYTDNSPDLVQCFYDVLDALERMRLPKAKWLAYETQVGHLLWGALVAIKLRRYLVEGHEGIVGTEGWKKFEEGMKVVQGRILGEVRE